MGAVDTLLAEHVNFRVTCVDRVGIAGYIRALQFEGGVVKFILQRGFPIPSPVVLARNHDRLINDISSFVTASGLAVVRFRKGDIKEDIARPYQEAAAAAHRPGVVLVGKAQERMQAWVGYKDNSSPLGTDRHPHFAFSRQAKVPDHFYFYCHDEEWGPALVKLAPFAPYPLWIVANGHQWLKRQLAAAGVEFAALDNGLRSVADPALAHRLAARLWSWSSPRWHRPLVGMDPEPADPRRPTPGVLLRLLRAPARDLRHRRVRRAPTGAGMVRGRHP